MSPNDPSEQGWQQVSSIDVAALTHAREQCHWAMQAIAAVGYAHIERADDDSQSNAGWVDGMQILAGRMVEGDAAFFVSLNLAELKLAIHEPGGDALDELSLDRHTLSESFDWLAAAIARRTGASQKSLEMPSYEMPTHALARGANFDFSEAHAFEELARWMHNANLVYLDLRKHTAGSTVPRVWPHHFDIGMLISLEDSADAQQGRSIGLGLSPGDGSDNTPYWYGNPYPQPIGELPPLAIGQWHREGWIGAVLRAEELWTAGDAATQEALVRGYVDGAIAAGRSLLERD
jgi:hypothetical protein